MAITDETILDNAPVTPAPIFAYRALRGLFFGSPADDDEVSRPKLQQQQHQHQSQAQGQRKNSSISSPSPSKKPRLNITIDEYDDTLNSTPSQKRKRGSGSMTTIGGTNGAIMSPTKSCLRTPGAVTPRRAMLRDVTVTFKDLRASTSPEMKLEVQKRNVTAGGGIGIQGQEQRKDSGVHGVDKENERPIVIPGKQDSTAEQGVSVSSVRMKSSPRKRVVSAGDALSGQQQPKKQQTQHPSIKDTGNQPGVPASEDQIAKTEQDMKKLIRYAQKMKEYARKQDEENMKLQKIIEELRRENERLKIGVEERKCGCQSSRGKQIERSGSEAAIGIGSDKQLSGRNASREQKDDDNIIIGRHERDTKKSGGSTVFAESRYTSEHLGQLSQQQRKQTKPSGSTSEANPSIKNSPQNHSKDHQKLSFQPTKSTHPANPIPLTLIDLSPPSSPPQPPKAIPPIKQPSKVADPPISIVTASPSTQATLLASARVAAARERIRRKTEMRKTSSISLQNHVPMSVELNRNRNVDVIAKSSSAAEARNGGGFRVGAGSGGESSGLSIVDWKGL